jgi:hypothetical protein
MICCGIAFLLVGVYAIFWLVGRVLPPTKAVAQLRRGAPDTIVYVPVFATWDFFPHPMLGWFGYDTYYDYGYYGGPIGVGNTVVYSSTTNTWIDNSPQAAQTTGSTTSAGTVDADVDPSDPTAGSDAVNTNADSGNASTIDSGSSSDSSVSSDSSSSDSSSSDSGGDSGDSGGDSGD